MSNILRNIAAYSLIGLTGGLLAYAGESMDVPVRERNLNQPIYEAIAQDVQGIRKNVDKKGPMLTRLVTDSESRNLPGAFGATGELALLGLTLSPLGLLKRKD
ncbi:hypothetical protein HOD88_01210 [archaeon]|jgi:hypothetical protein|nr:hypothetical protein [archaeon]